MLRTVSPERTLWDAILPAECLSLPAGLAEVDALLDDPRFFEPFRPHFSAGTGRPSIPLETYLRLMFLRFRYRLGFETLCAEVTDSLAWRRFCRIPLGEKVPHPTTLMKITTRCGPAAVDELNEALLARAAEEKVVRLDRVRADTTVVEADVAYPTDSGLLAKAITLLTRLAGRVHAAGGARRTRLRDRTRSAGRRARAIASKLKLRNDEAKVAVLAITGELAALAEASAAEAEAVLRNARRGLRRAGAEASGRLTALTEELEQAVEATRRIADQTRRRLAGDMPPGGERLVSLHDPDARPIAKGRLGRPVEFGFKAQVVDNAEGIVVDHSLHVGAPADAGLLAPAIERVRRRFGRAPKAVAADRGYGEASVDAALEGLGVKKVAIPRKGKPGAERRAVQRRRGFVKLIKWRTGCEGRISHLKHGYGWSRSLFDGIDGARTWCGWGVLAHNSVKIATLIEAKVASPAPPEPLATAPDPAGTGPPGRRRAPAA